MALIYACNFNDYDSQLTHKSPLSYITHTDTHCYIIYTMRIENYLKTIEYIRIVELHYIKNYIVKTYYVVDLVNNINLYVSQETTEISARG